MDAGEGRSFHHTFMDYAGAKKRCTNIQPPYKNMLVTKGLS